MIFQPQNLVLTGGTYLIPEAVNATAPPSLCKAIFSELWHNFTYQSSTLTLREADEFCFAIGNAKRLPLDGFSYTVNIEPEGICVSADSRQSLIHGMMTLLDRIRPTEIDGRLRATVDCAEIRERALIPVRMVHYCIFPKTPLWELRRFVRACAALKYTHIILEFWGSIRLDSFPQMAWPHAYTKAQVRELVAEIRALGMEIIPFVQHLGHAAMARQGASGKHVVLDQAPELEYLYKPGFDGWVWDYSKPVVRELLRNIRNELMELCGEGGYFAIGCDEADDLGQGEDGLAVAAELCEYLNGVQEELSAVGRRVIMWGDMLFSRADFKIDKPQPGEFYEGNSNHTFAEAMQNGLDKRIVIADWEYNIVSEEWKTAIAFKEKGFDVLCASFSGMTNIQTAIDTVKHHQLLGYMKTTWARIFREMGYVTYAGEAAWKGECWPNYPAYAKTVSRTFGLVRKICPCPDYKDAGWSPKQIEPSLH